MEIQEVIFIFQLIMIVGITMIKFYNVMSQNKRKTNLMEKENEEKDKPIFPYDIKISIILFVATIFLYGMGFTIQMLTVENLFYSSLFRYESLFLALNVLFFFIEMLFMVGDTTHKVIGAYQSSDARR